MASRPVPNAPAPTPVPERVSTFWTWVALFLALVGVAGTLYLSIGLELIACPLCFYQRTFIMAVAGVLLVGLGAGARRSGYLSLITLPLTVAGLGIAGLHVSKEANGDLECPDGIIPFLYQEARGQDDLYANMHEVVTAPRESLTILALLFLVQVVDVLRSSRHGGFSWPGLLGAILVGGGLAAGAYFSAGPGKIPPWPAPLRGCRPPHQG